MVRPPMGRFSMIPSAAVIDTRLTSLARDILGIISAHGNTKQAGWCYIYQRNIAEIVGVSRELVNRTVRKLTEYGYLDKKPSYLKSGARGYNWYRVRLDFDLPEQFSRLPVAPDDERAGADPPVIVGSHPLCRQDHTPVIVGSQPLIKDERGNLNGENLTEVTFPATFLEKVASDVGMTASEIRGWPWLFGVPVRSARLRDLKIERAKNAEEQEIREQIAAGRVPEFGLWEHAHRWRGALPNYDDRWNEYRKFAAIVGVRIAETFPEVMEEIVLEI